MPVWWVTCFYVRKGYRRERLTTAVIPGAVELARAAAAPAIESIPLAGTVSPSATNVAYASNFAAAGFEEIARRSPEGPITRRS